MTRHASYMSSGGIRSPDSFSVAPMYTPLAESVCDMARVPECPRPMVVINMGRSQRLLSALGLQFLRLERLRGAGRTDVHRVVRLLRRLERPASLAVPVQVREDRV